VEYVQRVSQVRDLARRYWFDVLVAALAIVAMLQVVLGFGSSGAPQTTLWFCVPAIAILALAVFARRRFPFAGPAVYWLLAAGISFVDPLLIPYANALFPIGMADAFLLGNLRDVRRAALGLAVVVGGAVTIVYNIPGHAPSELVFVPARVRDQRGRRLRRARARRAGRGGGVARDPGRAGAGQCRTDRGGGGADPDRA
jgi:hypothetical protein